MRALDSSFGIEAVRRGWPLVIPLLLFLPFLGAFPFPGSGGDYSDLAISHYPNAVYLRRALLEFHTIPFWSPTILSGYPFFANPLSGLWYPPGWIALLFPLPLGFNLMILLHILWGGAGVYRLLKAEGCTERAAMFGGIAFAAMPKIFAHYGAGHLTLLYAVTWTPWLMLASRREAERLQTVPIKQWWRHAGARPGIVLGLVTFADVRWLAYAGAAFVLYTLFHNPEKALPASLLHRLGRIRARLVHIGLSLTRIIAAGFYSALLTAPLTLPLLEYARLSTRSNMTSQDVFAYSLPYGRLLGLIYPDFGGFHEFMIYPGSAVLVLAFLALIWGGARVGGRFWSSLLVLSILYALGDGLPGMELLAEVPGMDLLRVPSRALFITGLSFIALAAYGLDRLIAGPSRAEIRSSNLGLTGLTGFVLILAAAAWVMSGNLAFGLAWGGGMLFVSTRWVRGSIFRLVGRRYWYAGLIGIALIDLWAIDYSLFRTKAPGEVLAEGSPAAAQLTEDHDVFRIYSPSYSIPQQTSALYELELADGIDPLQIASYQRFLLRAGGIPDDGAYSVTLPPFPSGDPRVDNRDFVPDPELLGILNIKYVVSHEDIGWDTDQIQRLRAGDANIYFNPMYRPRAWVQKGEDITSESFAPVHQFDWEPNRIEVSARGPGILVVSELAYPGWQVFVDGSRAEILTIGDILRAVEIDANEHQIVFVFRSVTLSIGIIGFLLGMLLLIAFHWLSADPKMPNG